jgi:hypothetical protein
MTRSRLKLSHSPCLQTVAAKGLHTAQRKALRVSRNATRQVTKAEGKLSVSDLKKSDLEGKRVRQEPTLIALTQHACAHGTAQILQPYQCFPISGFTWQAR